MKFQSRKMKVLKSLNWATEFLEQRSIEYSRRNSELLLCHLLKCRPAELYLDSTCLSSLQMDELVRLLHRRRNGLPIQYITGVTEFMGLEFIVNPAVFIPRPETELLVETVLNLLSRGASRRQVGLAVDGQIGLPITLLDLGTGCGNIAISLTKYLTHCKIIATDISQDALRVARRNARLHRVDDRISFFKGDLFEVFSGKKKKPNFKIIVSNPPYISSNQLKNLPLEVRREPEIALDAGEDGLDYYQRIIAEACEYLTKGGYLIMEIGCGQLDSISEIIETLGQLRLVEVIRDYSNIERIVVTQKI